MVAVTKIERIIKKYRFLLPNNEPIPNGHLRILCREYGVRFRNSNPFSDIHRRMVEKLQKKMKNRLAAHQILAIVKNEECPICYETFTPYRVPVFTQCMHAFCSHCLILHLKSSKRCPICRDLYVQTVEIREEDLRDPFLSSMDIVLRDNDTFTFAIHEYTIWVVYWFVNILVFVSTWLGVYFLYDELFIHFSNDSTPRLALPPVVYYNQSVVVEVA